MNDSQAGVAQSAKLAKEARETKRQLAIARRALEQFASCDLNEFNCADLTIASKRIRNIAIAALTAMDWLNVTATVKSAHEASAIEALRPFAKMYRSGWDCDGLVLARGTGFDATHLFERDFALAWKIVTSTEPAI